MQNRKYLLLVAIYALTLLKPSYIEHTVSPNNQSFTWGLILGQWPIEIQNVLLICIFQDTWPIVLLFKRSPLLWVLHALEHRVLLLLHAQDIMTYYVRKLCEALFRYEDQFTGVPLSTILSTAGWKRATTFARFYDKKVENEGWSMKDLV